MRGYWRRPEYLPTPAEIEQKCIEIQRRWTAQERDRRVRCESPATACRAAYEEVEKAMLARAVVVDSVLPMEC